MPTNPENGKNGKNGKRAETRQHPANAGPKQGGDMAERKRPASAWKPGQSGNPAGKARGTRNKATRAVMALMEGEANAITKTCIERAKAGDMTAIRLILDRLAPPARERSVSLPSLPDLSTAAGVSAALQAVAEALARGDLTPGEASTVTQIFEVRRRAIETEELERRIAALENGNDKTA